MSTETRPNNKIVNEWLGVKFFVLIIMLVFFVSDYSTVKSIRLWLLFSYALIMFVCSLSFFLTMFPPIRRVAYIIFGISLVSLLLLNRFNSEIYNEFKVVDCVEVGQVWDPEQKICRTDCLKWNKEKGCIPSK